MYSYSMTLIHAVILSIIEGITEFLPISSTGHLILAGKLLGIPSTEFAKSFEIFIQLGAIFAVVTLYLTRIMGKPALIRPIIIAFIPTGIIGFVLYKLIKTYLLGNDMVVVISLASIGLGLILLEKYWTSHPPKATKSIETLSMRELITIGIFQSFSVVPGVSRAAATIVGGMTNNLSRSDAVEFSFLLAVPTMAAATGLDLLKSGHSFSRPELTLLLVGFFVSWIVAAIVIRAFLQFVKTGTFTGFGIYRILVALIYLAVRSV